jgi:hypothetical protein
VTAQAYDQVIGGGDVALLGRDDAGRRLRGAALMTALVIIVAVAAVVLATMEWMAPASAGAVPG